LRPALQFLALLLTHLQQLPMTSHAIETQWPCFTYHRDGPLVGFLVIRDAVFIFHKGDAITDVNPLVRALSEHANRNSLAILQIDNCDLVRRIGRISLRGRVDCGLGIYCATQSAKAHDAAPRMVTTQVAPEPPRFCANPMRCFATWRSPASPRSCIITSQI